MNTSYVQGQSVEYGELKLALLTGNGPSSYSVANADPIANPAAGDYINFPMDCTTQSGDYSLTAVPTVAGQLRAGGASASASGWQWLWFNNGSGGVTVTQNVAGSGMTPGTVVPIVFSGGTGGGAAGTVTVLTATTISITITNRGYYTTAPTATVTGTGGTPPTLTVAATTTRSLVTNGTDLSKEVVQFGAIVSQL